MNPYDLLYAQSSLSISQVFDFIPSAIGLKALSLRNFTSWKETLAFKALERGRL